MPNDKEMRRKRFGPSVWVGAAEGANIQDCSIWTLYNRTKRGLLKSYMIGGSRKWRRAELEKIPNQAETGGMK
jgi:hypothetical protein